MQYYVSIDTHLGYHTMGPEACVKHYAKRGALAQAEAIYLYIILVGILLLSFGFPTKQNNTIQLYNSTVKILYYIAPV
jgi:hypothetical protein